MRQIGQIFEAFQEKLNFKIDSDPLCMYFGEYLCLKQTTKWKLDMLSRAREQAQNRPFERIAQ